DPPRLGGARSRRVPASNPRDVKVPRTLAISDRAALALDWESWCARLAEVGVEALQIREKALPDRELLALACAARRAFPPPELGSTSSGRRTISTSSCVESARREGPPHARDLRPRRARPRLGELVRAPRRGRCRGPADPRKGAPGS